MWVEIVAQGVADEVETQYREHDCECREKNKVWRIEQMRAGVVEHRSPTGGRRRHTEPKKAHGRFGEDGPRHADCGLHDDRLNDVGKDVTHDDAKIAGAERARRFHKLTLARRE